MGALSIVSAAEKEIAPHVFYVTGIEKVNSTEIIAKSKIKADDEEFLIHRYEIDIENKNIIRISTDWYSAAGRRKKHLDENISYKYGDSNNEFESKIADLGIEEYNEMMKK